MYEPFISFSERRRERHKRLCQLADLILTSGNHDLIDTYVETMRDLHFERRQLATSIAFYHSTLSRRDERLRALMREYGGEDLFNKYINILANGSADVMDDFQYPEARVQRSLTSKLEDAERAHDKVLEENVRLTLEVEALKKALSHATTEVHVPDINKD